MGIDTIAHQSTITANGQTIAVLGSGIDYCYPHRNQQLYQVLKDHHLVISEYQQSGTMITVGHGLEQGKDIYCVPSRINDALGCNYLIQQGAKLVINVSDILNG